MKTLFRTFPQKYNPGQNVLGHLRKLGTKTHFAKLTRILPLKKAWRCCYKGLFLLSPSPPSSVDCVELKLECITPTLHRGGRGEGRCLNLTSYCVSVPRVLTRVVVVIQNYHLTVFSNNSSFLLQLISTLGFKGLLFFVTMATNTRIHLILLQKPRKSLAKQWYHLII